MKSLLYKSAFNSKRSIFQFFKPSSNTRTYLSANINNFGYYEHIDSENLKYIDPINVPSTPNEKFNHKDFLIIPDFITKEEEEMLVAKSNFKLRRIRHYEDSHFDGVIQNYKEVTVSDWAPFQNEVNPILERAKSLIKDPINWLPAHILDLGAKGGIDPHVDNIQASGDYILGLCLLSDSVIVFKSEDYHFEVLAKARSLYMQRKTIRYNFTHAIPTLPQDHKFKDVKLDKNRRISWMLRDMKPLSK